MQNDRYPFAPPEPGGDKPAPRRRRRPTRGQGPRQGQNSAAPAPQQPAADGKDAPRAGTPGRDPRRPARGGQNAARPPKRANAPAPKRDAAHPPRPKEAQAQPAAEGKPPRRTAPRHAPAVAEDPGLLLISRRPPKQKFANFEEYIAAHGGVTSPLPDDSGEA